VLGFSDNDIPADGMLNMLARLGEYRFCVFELQRRVLTEAQSDVMFHLRKQIVSAVASFEALERFRSRELIEGLVGGFARRIARLQTLWSESATLIATAEELGNVLEERQSIGYALLELRVLHLHHRLLDLEIESHRYRLFKSDIYLRSVLYGLATRLGYKEEHPVAPGDFFWRNVAKAIG